MNAIRFVGVSEHELFPKRTAVVLRHGADHAVLPHEVNYRGIIWALRELGARCIFATAAVGSLVPELRTGDPSIGDRQ